ncbi:MAG: hypothetical protein IIC56_07945, partial [Proteobacteria bacterium]|nr:hypothetical protein [Pseudomonadota bacterium]
MGTIKASDDALNFGTVAITLGANTVLDTRASADVADLTIGAVTGGMSAGDLRIFEDFLIARNQRAALDRGEPLREGFTGSGEVDGMIASLDGIIAERPAVRDALETRARINGALVGELIKNDLLPEQVADNV